jgi:hypothetical protein
MDRGYAREGRSSYFRPVSGNSLPDRVGEPFYDCWPDNTTSGSLPPFPEQVLEANSPRRVFLEFGAVVSVATVVALLANYFV